MHGTRGPTRNPPLDSTNRRTFDLNKRKKRVPLGTFGHCNLLLSAHPGRIEFLLFDIAKVFEELFPPLAEEPGFVPATPPLLNILRIHCVIVVSHDTSETIEQIDHFLYWYNTDPINSRFRERR